MSKAAIAKLRKINREAETVLNAKRHGRWHGVFWFQPLGHLRQRGLTRLAGGQKR